MVSRDVKGLDEAEKYLSRGSTRGGGASDAPGFERPVAMIDGEPVMWEALRAGLGEAAGNEVLNEIALEARLVKRMAREGLLLEPAMVERERDMFAEATAYAGVSGEDAAAALDRVRRQRGLGPTRFASMLRRSAMLRALVQPQVRVNEAAIAQAYALRHGERFRARVMTMVTAREASDAVARVRGGEDFSRVAAEVSTDASAARGGVIEPVSLADASYPQALRDTLAKMTAGQVSDPIALGDGFTVVMLDGRGVSGGAGGAPALESVRAEMEREARRRQERLLMEQLAREIGSGANVRPLDGALRWSVDGGR